MCAATTLNTGPSTSTMFYTDYKGLIDYQGMECMLLSTCPDASAVPMYYLFNMNYLLVCPTPSILPALDIITVTGTTTYKF